MRFRTRCEQRQSLDALAAVFRDWVRSVDAAGNLVVIKTPPGSAHLVGVALDQSELPRSSGRSAATTRSSSPFAMRRWRRGSSKGFADCRFSSLRHFDVSTEPEPHGRQKLVTEGMFDPAAIAREQGGAEDIGRDRFLHCGIDGPMPFATVGDLAREMVEHMVVGEADGAQIEQPGGDDRSAPPDLGDVGEVEGEPFILGQLVGASPLQDVEAFGERPASGHIRSRCGPSSRNDPRPAGPA